jgi:radical SAM superfamily enzyme YgiQ (UPF0313 family)
MMKIFLGDLVHTGSGTLYTGIPLNIGYVATYAQKYHTEKIHLQLFKRPEKMIDAICKFKPDLVGLSFYVWNINLNNYIFEIAKKVNPLCLTVGGGPTITNLDANRKGAEKFFQRASACDIYVLNQGEKGFSLLLDHYSGCGGSIKKLKEQPIPGCITAVENDYLIGAPLSQLYNLDDIPSPYLTGLMDPFLEESFIPLIETNRGCPYRCSFCAWGITAVKVSCFSGKYSLNTSPQIKGRPGLV